MQLAKITIFALFFLEFHLGGFSVIGTQDFPIHKKGLPKLIHPLHHSTSARCLEHRKDNREQSLNLFRKEEISFNGNEFNLF